MKTQSLVAASVSGFIFLFLFLVSCKKINEATELGGELIPPVDNITTFDTTLNVLAYNHLFTESQDSVRSRGEYTQFLGSISNDPLFGKTEAALYFQLKPTGTFPFRFPFKAKDSLLGLDSIVLVLNTPFVYGDSLSPQQVGVYEISQSANFRDSFYLIRNSSFSVSNPLAAPKSFLPYTLNDSVFPYGERAANQLRIRLDDAFGQRLLNYDSTNAYKSDSLFNTYFKGFAVLPEGNGSANSLIAVNLADTNTKLSIYYRYVNNGKADTAVTNFRFTTSSVSANHIQRDHSGSALAASAGDEVADDVVYIQNTPGSYATVKIPGLNDLSNRVVHRAELIVEQVYDPLAGIFTPPPYLYVDAYDTAVKAYRTIPLDVTFNQGGQINPDAFGMAGKQAQDAMGNSIRVWRFNLSRYIQNVANKTLPAYDLRLYSPFVTRSLLPGETTVRSFFVNPYYAAGRVRVGGGNHPTQQMRLRIIYSRL